MIAQPAQKPSRPTLPVLLFLTAILLGGGYYFDHYLDVTRVNAPLQADAGDYMAYAQNLLEHGVYSRQQQTQNPAPDAYRSPGYPLLLAFCAVLAKRLGTSFGAVLFPAQLLLGLGAILLTWVVGRRFLGNRLALLPTLLTALSPHLVAMSGYVLTETLFTFLLLLGLWLLQLLMTEGRHRPWLALPAGLAWGACYLTNEGSLLLWPVLGLAFWLFARAGDQDIIEGSPKTRTILVLALALLLLFPLGWGVRKALVVQSDNSRALDTLTHGAYPEFGYIDEEGTGVIMYDDPRHEEFSSSLGSFLEIFGERVAAEPGAFAKWYLVQKPVLLWNWSILQGEGDVFVYGVETSPFHRSVAWNLLRLIMKWLHAPLVLLAFGGLLLFALRFRQQARGTAVASSALPIFACLLYFTLLYTVFAPFPRYSVPLRPELYMAATWSGLAIFDALRGKLRRKTASHTKKKGPAKPARMRCVPLARAIPAWPPRSERRARGNACSP